MCVFAFSFTMTCCRIWDQHSSHEHAHNWMDTPFHPFYVFIPFRRMSWQGKIIIIKNHFIWKQLNLRKCRSRDMNMTFIRCSYAVQQQQTTRPTRKGQRDKGRRCAPQVKLRQIFSPPLAQQQSPSRRNHQTTTKFIINIFSLSPGGWGMRNEKESSSTLNSHRKHWGSFIISFFWGRWLITFFATTPKGPSHQSRLPALLEFLTRNLIISHLPRNSFLGHFPKWTWEGKKSLNSLTAFWWTAIDWLFPKSLWPGNFTTRQQLRKTTTDSKTNGQCKNCRLAPKWTEVKKKKKKIIKY